MQGNESTRSVVGDSHIAPEVRVSGKQIAYTAVVALIVVLAYERYGAGVRGGVRVGP